MSDLRTAQQLYSEADYIVRNATAETFGPKQQALFEAKMRLHDAARADHPQIAQLSRKAQAEMFARTIDPATLAFFCGHRPQQDQISVSAGFIERQQAYQFGGRSRGATTLLKDYSSVLAAENRTYAGLSLLAFRIKDIDNLKFLIRAMKPARLLRSRTSSTDSSLPLTETAVIESDLVSASSSGVKESTLLSRPSTSARAVPLSPAIYNAGKTR